jgi:6-pyruvoyltetrahydropterin/6-carboxytetrahydropterin synthase
MLLTTAQAGFDAARRGPARQDGRAALTGHGFVAWVATALPDGWAPYAGGEVSALGRRLQACTAELDGRLLDDFTGSPADDAALAQWISSHLALPGPTRVQVRCRPVQGAERVTLGQRRAPPGEPETDLGPHERIWRRYRFQSAHRLPHVPAGHKCGRMHGHGFEALIVARTTAGNPGTDRLDDAWAPLFHQLNYRCLNQLSGLENPTSEHLAAWIWHQLAPRLGTLERVAVLETASCGAVYDGQRHRIWKDFHFDSATRLQHAPPSDPRSQLHGHTYQVRLHLAAPLDPLLGWAVDFGDVKAAFKPVFDAVDHRDLQEVLRGQDGGALDGDTASLAQWIFTRTHPLLNTLVQVDVTETPGCGSQWLASPPAGSYWAEMPPLDHG